VFHHTDGKLTAQVNRPLERSQERKASSHPNTWGASKLEKSDSSGRQDSGAEKVKYTVSS
jgi:hypothetical protein